MFYVPLTDFHFAMETFDYLGLTFKVRTLELVDVRELSSSCVYPKILSENQDTGEADSSGFLSVIFKSYEGEVEKTLNICVGNPILNLSLDTVLDILDSYLLLVYAVQVAPRFYPNKRFFNSFSDAVCHLLFLLLQEVITPRHKPRTRHKLEQRKTIVHPDADSWNTISIMKISIDIAPLQALFLQNSERCTCIYFLVPEVFDAISTFYLSFSHTGWTRRLLS